MYTLKIDPDRPLGPIRDLHGVGGGPLTNHFTYDATEDFRAAGIPEEAIASVHTPVGLPIGAVTPEEIAVSIAAEMILVRAQQRAAKTGVPAHHCPV